MGGEAGILALLTAPLAVVAGLGGLVGAVLLAAHPRPPTTVGGALLGTLALSFLLVPLGFALGVSLAVRTGPVLSALLVFPAAGVGAAGGLVLGALTASGRLRRAKPRPTVLGGGPPPGAAAPSSGAEA